MGPIGTAALGIGTGLAEGAAEQIFGEMNQKRELRGQKKLWNNRMPQQWTYGKKQITKRRWDS